MACLSLGSFSAIFSTRALHAMMLARKFLSCVCVSCVCVCCQLGVEGRETGVRMIPLQLVQLEVVVGVLERGKGLEEVGPLRLLAGQHQLDLLLRLGIRDRRLQLLELGLHRVVHLPTQHDPTIRMSGMREEWDGG